MSWSSSGTYSGFGAGLSAIGQGLTRWSITEAEQQRKDNLERLRMQREDERYQQSRNDFVVGYSEEGKPVTRAQYESGEYKGPLYSAGKNRKEDLNKPVDPDNIVEKDVGGKKVKGIYVQDGQGNLTFQEMGEGVTVPEKRTGYRGGLSAYGQRPLNPNSIVEQRDAEGNIVQGTIIMVDGAPVFQPLPEGVKKMPKEATPKAPREITPSDLKAANAEEARILKGYNLEKGDKIPPDVLAEANRVRAAAGKPPLVEKDAGKSRWLAAPQFSYSPAEEGATPKKAGGLSQQADKEPLDTSNAKGVDSSGIKVDKSTDVAALAKDIRSLPVSHQQAMISAAMKQMTPQQKDLFLNALDPSTAVAIPGATPGNLSTPGGSRPSLAGGFRKQ